MKHTDNLSKTIRATSVPAVEGRRLSQLRTEVLKKLRTDEYFDQFWAYAEKVHENLNVCKAFIPRLHKRPRCYENGTADHYHPATPYKQIYFEALDAAVVAIEDRFDQNDYSMYAKLEQLLVTPGSYTERLYSNFTRGSGLLFNPSELEIHLELFNHMDINCAGNEMFMCTSPLYHQLSFL